MKKSLYTLILAAFVSLAAVCAQAGEVTSEAVVLSVSGMPMASIGGKAPVGLKVGDKLPEGTVVTTPANSEVVFKAFEQSETMLAANSRLALSKLSIATEGGRITKQTALMDLTEGTVVSTLDPKLKEINDYGIRTPRGIAAARGTKYTVVVNKDGSTTTLVQAGTVVFINSVTRVETRVEAGYSVTVGAKGEITGPKLITDSERNVLNHMQQSKVKRSYVYGKEGFVTWDKIENDDVDTTITVSPSSP